MRNGTVIADLCYEYLDSGITKYRRIGALYYYRSLSKGTPSAQIRLDVIPSKAWELNAEVYFIGNFLPTEKVPDAPYVCGEIYVPSDIRGEQEIIGHIQTREYEDEREGVQYYFQLFGVPLREVGKCIRSSYIRAIKENESCSGDELLAIINERIDNRTMSMYLGIRLDG